MSKVFAAEHTRALEEVIREIEVDTSTFKGAEYLPAVDMPVTEIFVDVWEARGGMVKEHTGGADPQASARRQFRTQSFTPGTYKEFITFNEMDILRLRQLGKNDQSGRGIRQHLNENALVLNNKIETRMEYLRWQAIFNGTYVFDGKTVDFGKLGSHNVSPAFVWATLVSGVWVANASATPVQDLRVWILGGYAPFRKYKITKLVMNPNTARVILDNPNVQSLIQYRFGSDAYDKHTPEALLSFLIPGMPPVDIYQGWYQNESQDATTGAITVGDANYFIPDGGIYFECKLPDGNKIGDFCCTLSLANGSVDNPQAGKFIIVSEHIEDKPENPYINVIGGVYGGPRLKRGPDVLTATTF